VGDRWAAGAKHPGGLRLPTGGWKTK